MKLGKTYQERQKNIPKFLKYIEDNPQIEELYMNGIRIVAELNRLDIDKYYRILTKNTNADRVRKWTWGSMGT